MASVLQTYEAKVAAAKAKLEQERLDAVEQLEGQFNAALKAVDAATDQTKRIALANKAGKVLAMLESEENRAVLVSATSEADTDVDFAKKRKRLAAVRVNPDNLSRVQRLVREAWAALNAGKGWKLSDPLAQLQDAIGAADSALEELEVSAGLRAAVLVHFGGGDQRDRGLGIISDHLHNLVEKFEEKRRERRAKAKKAANARG